MKKCKYEDSNGNCTHTEIGGSCKDIPCCYMKQLIIKNEELKAKIKEYEINSKCAWKCFEGTLCEEGEKYKQALEEIKKITNKYLDMKYIVSCVTPLCEIKIKIDEVLR